MPPSRRSGGTSASLVSMSRSQRSSAVFDWQRELDAVVVRVEQHEQRVAGDGLSALVDFVDGIPFEPHAEARTNPAFQLSSVISLPLGSSQAMSLTSAPRTARPRKNRRRRSTG